MHLQSGWRLWIKKVVDCSAALCGLVVLSPLFIIASLARVVIHGTSALVSPAAAGAVWKAVHVIQVSHHVGAPRYEREFSC